MGMNPMKSCFTNSSVNSIPNPDPSKWCLLSSRQIGSVLVVEVKYIGCTNFEGKKIMVYENLTIQEIVDGKSLDPHFQEISRFSPIARFRPTSVGWELALDFANILNRKNQFNQTVEVDETELILSTRASLGLTNPSGKLINQYDISTWKLAFATQKHNSNEVVVIWHEGEPQTLAEFIVDGTGKVDWKQIRWYLKEIGIQDDGGGKCRGLLNRVKARFMAGKEKLNDKV